MRDASGNFSAGTVTANLAGNAATASNVVAGIGITNAFITNSVFAGDGGGLTNLNVPTASLTGTIPLVLLTGITSNQLDAATWQMATNMSGSITVTAGSGLSGGGTVPLGGSTTLNNAGVLSVTGNADITVTNVGGEVTLGDTATNIDTPGTIVKRDAGGNFSAGTITLAGTLNMENGLTNTAVGFQALQNCTSGYDNIALGYDAGLNLTTEHNNIDIGNEGVASVNGAIRIGSAQQTSTFIAGISGVVVAGGAAVYVNANNQLGVRVSSEQFKQDIQNMGDASDSLLALRPVTFRYKPELDPKGTPEFGLVAEEVEKVDPDLVLRDNHDQIYTVRYEAVNAMLLNEFLKEHRKVEAQNARLQSLEQSVGELKAVIEKLTVK